MTKYAESLNPRKNRKKTKFGNPFIIMGGQRKDLRRMIKENAKETSIYEQIEKYGLNPISEPTIEETVQDFTKIAGNLRDSIEKGMIAREKWNQIPRKIREEFDNDINRFMTEGPTWMQKKHQEFLAKQQPQQQEPQAKPQGGNNE